MEKLLFPKLIDTMDLSVAKLIIFNLIKNYSFSEVVKRLFDRKKDIYSPLNQSLLMLVNKIGINNLLNLIYESKEGKGNNSPSKNSFLSHKRNYEPSFLPDDLEKNNKNDKSIDDLTLSNYQTKNYRYKRIKGKMKYDNLHFNNKILFFRNCSNNFEYNKNFNKTPLFICTTINNKKQDKKYVCDNVNDQISENQGIGEEKFTKIISLIYGGNRKRRVLYYMNVIEILENEAKLKCFNNDCLAFAIYNLRKKELKLLRQHSNDCNIDCNEKGGGIKNIMDEINILKIYEEIKGIEILTDDYGIRTKNNYLYNLNIFIKKKIKYLYDNDINNNNNNENYYDRICIERIQSFELKGKKNKNLAQRKKENINSKEYKKTHFLINSYSSAFSPLINNRTINKMNILFKCEKKEENFKGIFDNKKLIFVKTVYKEK